MFPKLQIALDNASFSEAITDIKDVVNEIDIIEVGTILLCSEGKRVVKYLKTLYPNKIIVADAKIADAGKIITSMMFDVGADWTTVICSADISTVKGALEIARQAEKDIQIELIGHWSFDQAQQWRSVGVKQVVYHRSRDAQASGVKWGPEDLNKIEKLCSMGFNVTVTGGITAEDIKLFKDLPIYVFIAGRAIREAKYPNQAANQFKQEIMKYWK
ncbi:Orotidine 5'-phosphate decarboxylase [Thermoanaerobacter mathranii subsp. mathranii str. A3]|uniref:Orotidine 5'-phosphate decarboxylase n=1 Tax=Thermoanaerobacter mathranii subsp. mathranii (strain DSM 11426 / CCUG 53645 / CIP 108742 / A3) TaxID=583358 RepID=A0ABN3YZ75_THEM3|nr:3-keto-L-gulonate-6-phosphate decarboxylase UlaD [Thermoanaerobacter mathranii]ADH60122.1 Orotidine 5'-phosphate decarboxylase [Thermoanaerobacter mathranii subsp. mathranii str. A3]